MSRPSEQPAPAKVSASNDLKSSEVIKRLFGGYTAEPPSSAYTQWQNELLPFLKWVRGAAESERSNLEFQIRLWDENKISSVGRGAISVDAAMRSAHLYHDALRFRNVSPELSVLLIPASGGASWLERIDFYESHGVGVVMLERSEADQPTLLKVMSKLGF